MTDVSSGERPPARREERRSAAAATAAFWSRPAADVLAALGATPAGLDPADAARRLAARGPSGLGQSHRSSALALLLGQFRSPLVLMLIGAAGLSFAVGSISDAVIILAIVVLSGVLGFWQEHTATRAVERLLALVAVRAQVVRGGATREVPVEALVPGDVVLLSAGSLVPADALVLESKDLHADEAALTGETFPAEKSEGVCAAEAGLAERTCALYFGTHVVSGTARALVVLTGADTEYGHIAGRLQHRPPPSEFEHGVQRFGFMLVRITAALTILIFAAHVFSHRPVLDSFMFALALAVGLVPELLPAIVGVTLAHGARRMARTHVIVKRLAAIENFGSMDVLCSDKTGTLTEGHVTMEGALDLDGAASDEVLRWAAANASFETGMANPIDAAVCAACKLDLSDLHKLDEVPYDFVRKRLSVLVGRRGEAGTVLVTKGALDQVLEVCSGARRAGSTVPLADVRAAIDARFAELSERGLRTLGLAVRELPGPARVGKADERDMTFLGFLAFFDPPKPDIERTIADLRGLGVRLKIVTGDNRRVAAAVARRVGFADPAVLSGPELHTMSDAALVRRAAQIDVFAEVEPNQKERIILALKKAGAVVGYIGDGINDAPALHVADVGISVEGAVDVAKEAAEIVLLKSDLRVLVDGVREGRTTFANTLKYVFITTSANFGNMLSMAGAALFLPFLPLLPKQILLNNFLSDFPAMTIATDRVDPEQVERPRRWDTRAIRTFMLVFGAVSSLFDVLCFGALWWLGADAEHFRSGWFVLSLLTEVLILLVVRTRRPLIRSRPSRAMAIVTAAVAVGSVALLYLPGAHWLGFAALPARYLAAIGALTLGYVAVSEAAKGWFFRHFGSA